ncbi:MAG TPA: hypothetical protein VF479_08700, partial [Pseudolysinimonas sp.]
MRILRRGVLPATLLALVLAGCAPAASGPADPTQQEPAAEAPESLVGTYSVEYRTTESDHDAITDETIVRDAEVSGSCGSSPCQLTFTTELKGPDGSTTTGTTTLTFDGGEYRGTNSATFSCDGMTTLTTVDDGLEYTSETTITPSATTTENGTIVVTSFDIVTVEHNEITAAGRDAGCLKINLSGSDPYSTND